MTRLSSDDGIDILSSAEHSKILTIINAAAKIYEGVIPHDHWHDPYMSGEELELEINDGVRFSGLKLEGRLVGVMGVQRRRNVNLIRHAYVLPDMQGRGAGSRLLSHLCRDVALPILIGTWAGATWAIRFYERHGFTQVNPDDAAMLLNAYWNVPARQVSGSVVLASSAMNRRSVRQLIDSAASR